MEEQNASSVLNVTDPEAARFLGDPKHLRFIAPFLGRERRLSEVALEIGSPLSTLYRRVARYCEVGLLQVTREEPRGGRAIKFYRTTADAYFVPHRVGDALEARSERWQRHWERDFRRGWRHAYGGALETWGERFYRRDGVFASALASGPDADLDLLAADMPALLSRFHDSVYLDFAEAKAFQRELEALLERYLTGTGQQRYLLRLNFVPVPEDAAVIP